MRPEFYPKVVSAIGAGYRAGKVSFWFWVTSALLVLFLYASAAPTPLYRVYQTKWGFSSATLTAVFAIYVLFLLATLLTFGSLSDHVGRRPLILTAIVVDVVAFVLFLAAHGTALLFVARAPRGSCCRRDRQHDRAVLLDLRPDGGLAPLLSSNGSSAGLALGVLLSAVLVPRMVTGGTSRVSAA